MLNRICSSTCTVILAKMYHLFWVTSAKINEQAVDHDIVYFILIKHDMNSID